MALAQLKLKTLNDNPYNNQKAVKALFNEAFGIDVDLSPLEAALDVRNDIMHRFGRTKSGAEVVLSLEEVQALIQSVDAIVKSTAKQIMAYQKSISIEN